MFVQEMIEQTQAELKEAQVTTVSAMNDLDPIISFSNHTQIDDPDVGQTSSDQQASQTLWIGDVTFMQVEPSALLVGKEGFDAVPFGVPVTSAASD